MIWHSGSKVLSAFFIAASGSEYSSLLPFQVPAIQSKSIRSAKMKADKNHITIRNSVRVYDGGKSLEKSADRYSLVLLFPTKSLQQKYASRGWIIGCNCSSDCMLIADSMEIPAGTVINGNSFHLGRRIEQSSLPKPMRQWVSLISQLWNVWLQNEDDESWMRLRRTLGK